MLVAAFLPVYFLLQDAKNHETQENYLYWTIVGRRHL